jgi:SNF2 family DNA or RNA helicase
VIVQTEGDNDNDENEDIDIDNNEDNDIAVDDSNQLLVDVDEEYLHAAMKCHMDTVTESHAMSNSCSAVSGSQVDPRRRKSDPHSEMVEEDKGLNKEDKGLNKEDKGPIEALIDGGDVIDEARVVYSTMQDVQLVEQPVILKAQLHEHQIEGISWMVHMFQHGVPMILGDQMGLGKTLQSIGFLAYLHSRLNKKGPYLIVVPLSVLSNWLAEIERFCPSFRAVRFHGKCSIHSVSPWR